MMFIYLFFSDILFIRLMPPDVDDAHADALPAARRLPAPAFSPSPAATPSYADCRHAASSPHDCPDF